MVKVGVYLRVSTERCRCRHGQKRHATLVKTGVVGGGSCELCDCKAFELEQSETCQEPECLQLCQARGWESVVYRERESGAKARPVWRELVESVRRGQLGGVVFWALDRTGRSRVQVTHDLSELFRYGAEVTSVKDSWLDQAKGPMRDLLVQIMAWVAEGERARLIERTKAGQQRARDSGKRIGRPGLSPSVVKILEACFAEGCTTASQAALAAGVPSSTARTYYRRFEEAAKSGSPLGGGKAAKNQGRNRVEI